jgi:glutaredoxin
MSNVRVAALAAFVACASFWGASADAQVYRIVGADGKVTFSDRPPPDAKAAPAQAVPMANSGSGASTANLPAEVRQAAGRFPVTIYNGADCGPCLTARSYLLRRGVPFTEKSIVTEDDVQALQRISGGTSMPFATIGAQHIRGFNEVEWSQYLDAAGYPRTSQLPASYRNPEPTPLVAAQQPRPAAAPATTARAPVPQVETPAPSEPGPANPAGIRF